MKAYTINNPISGRVTVTEDLGLIAPNGRKYTRAEVEKIAKTYSGVNRMHKPMALLFWTDVKNGKLENWKLEQ